MTTLKGAPVAILKLREDKLTAYRRIAGLSTDTALAQKLGVDPTTVYRVLNGKTEMSARFIAGIVDAFGSDLFADLFEVVSEGEVAA
jgi:transcriptional regulator with XRE-family HTH domain